MSHPPLGAHKYTTYKYSWHPESLLTSRTHSEIEGQCDQPHVSQTHARANGSIEQQPINAKIVLLARGWSHPHHAHYHAPTGCIRIIEDLKLPWKAVVVG